MNRTAAAVIAAVVGAGCAGGPAAVYPRPDAGRMRAAGPAAGVTSLLLAAGEDDWRKEIDVGPLDFDEAGKPVVEPGAPKRKMKARRFAVRLGPATDVSMPDASGDLEVREEGPVFGASYSMGGRAWKFAVEVGIDIWSVSGEYSRGGNFTSTLTSPRADALYHFQGAAKKTRVYALFGYRSVQERAEVYDAVGYLDEYVNQETGWALGGGIRTGQWDFRFERVEISTDETRLTAMLLTAAFRF
jgi:hypothetical protein